MQLGRLEAQRPYSHHPGVLIPIPGTHWIAQCYPKLLSLLGPKGERVTLSVPIEGLVTDWRVQLDLERGEIRQWGKADTFFEWRLSLEEGQIRVQGLRRWDWKESLAEVSGEWKRREVTQFGEHALLDTSRWGPSISLGKIFPSWHALGASLEVQEKIDQELSLLGSAARALNELRPEAFASAMRTLWHCGLGSMFAPMDRDALHWGSPLPPVEGSSWEILSRGSQLIRHAILQVRDFSAWALPCLPRELPSGRLFQARWPGVGWIDLEWTKHSVRRLLLTCEHTAEVHLEMGGVRTARWTDLELNERQSWRQGEPIRLLAGKRYLLDRVLA